MAELTRIKGAQNLTANKGYKGEEVAINDFDSKEPWNEMKIFQDEITGDWWVRIYKFYTYYNNPEHAGNKFELFQVLYTYYSSSSIVVLLLLMF